MPQVSYAVSRVLYLTIIYLVLQLPAKSSGLKGRERTHICPSALHQVGFTEQKLSLVFRWSLTPPFHPYQSFGGLFLLHFP